MLLAGVSTPRPMTIELTANLLDVASMKIEKIAITSLRKDTYYATMWVEVHGGIREIDARPSDAVSLALQTNAPIYVAPEVLESNQYLFSPDTVIRKLNEMHQKSVEANLRLQEETEMQWRSFRSLPRGDLFS
jgi:bifunctional DNase/RNase